MGCRLFLFLPLLQKWALVNKKGKQFSKNFIYEKVGAVTLPPFFMLFVVNRASISIEPVQRAEQLLSCPLARLALPCGWWLCVCRIRWPPQLLQLLSSLCSETSAWEDKDFCGSKTDHWWLYLLLQLPTHSDENKTDADRVSAPVCCLKFYFPTQECLFLCCLYKTWRLTEPCL